MELSAQSLQKAETLCTRFYAHIFVTSGVNYLCDQWCEFGDTLPFMLLSFFSPKQVLNTVHIDIFGCRLSFDNKHRKPLILTSICRKCCTRKVSHTEWFVIILPICNSRQSSGWEFYCRNEARQLYECRHNKQVLPGFFRICSLVASRSWAGV